MSAELGGDLAAPAGLDAAGVSAPSLAVATSADAAGPNRADDLGFWQRHRLAYYIVKRIGAGLATMLVASILTFTAIILLPGDVVQSVLGRNANPDQVAILRHQLSGGLPPWEQYLKFLGNFLRGDLGNSTTGLVQGRNVSVGGVVGPALWHSAVLAIIALILFVPIMITLGVLAGLKPGSPRDTVISVGSLSLGAVPEFFIGTVLIAIFFDALGWLPPVSSAQSGSSVFAHPSGLVLPIATLLLVSLAFGSRQLRSSVANILSQDYVTFAQLNGYSRSRIIRRFILPNALGPTVQIVAQQMQYLLAGIVIVESVFNYPGIGNQVVHALGGQDVQETLVISTILAGINILINLVADVVAVLLVPAVRTSL